MSEVQRYTCSGIMTPVPKDAETTTKWIKEPDHVKALEKSQPEWISVDDRLPDFKVSGRYINRVVKCTPVLVINAEGFQGVAVWNGDDWTLDVRNSVGAYERRWQSIYDAPYYSEITHWMPLPEPPKELERVE